ncbi:hypothetical protein PAPYR_10868 [Paratrimastix pyriformis]|uniref:Protein kinase domain-containing protein n=1 Tax=Paratrimastix pyriformis TaxID=342808 RepID=A0ABQ8U6T6_9EUKA|nr:hypothetical protein PAPYR_10868 [Paratrimastix pyriformis]
MEVCGHPDPARGVPFCTSRQFAGHIAHVMPTLRRSRLAPSLRFWPAPFGYFSVAPPGWVLQCVYGDIMLPTHPPTPPPLHALFKYRGKAPSPSPPPFASPAASSSPHLPVHSTPATGVLPRLSLGQGVLTNATPPKTFNHQAVVAALRPLLLELARESTAAATATAATTSAADTQPLPPPPAGCATPKPIKVQKHCTFKRHLPFKWVFPSLSTGEFGGASDLQLVIDKRPLFNLEVNHHMHRKESIVQYLKYSFLSALGLFIAHPTMSAPCYGIYIDHKCAFVSSHQIVAMKGPDASELRFEVKMIDHAFVSPEQAKEAAKAEKIASKAEKTASKAKAEAKGTVLKKCEERAMAVRTATAVALVGRLLAGGTRQTICGSLRTLAARGFDPVPDGALVGILPDHLLLQLQPKTEPVRWERLAPGRSASGHVSARNLYVIPAERPPGATAGAAGAAGAPTPLAYLKLMPRLAYNRYRRYMLTVGKDDPAVLHVWMIFDNFWTFVRMPTLGESLATAPPRDATTQLAVARALVGQVIRLVELGVAHNDLRLANVVWRPSNPESVRIIDFDRCTDLDEVLSVTHHSKDVPEVCSAWLRCSLPLPLPLPP